MVDPKRHLGLFQRCLLAPREKFEEGGALGFGGELLSLEQARIHIDCRILDGVGLQDCGRVEGRCPSSLFDPPSAAACHEGLLVEHSIDILNQGSKGGVNLLIRFRRSSLEETYQSRHEVSTIQGGESILFIDC